jgi:hypothetical protein
VMNSPAEPELISTLTVKPDALAAWQLKPS